LTSYLTDPYTPCERALTIDKFGDPRARKELAVTQSLALSQFEAALEAVESESVAPELPAP